MPRDHHHEMDTETAERLLAGHGDGPPRLSKLLSRAAAPSRPDELAGEDAAVAVFRSARLAAVSAPRRRIVTGRWTQWATVKAGVLAFALAGGGVALAAGTGVLPNPLTIGEAPPSRTPDLTSSVSSAWTGRDSTDAPSAVGHSPSTSIHGLCKAHLARVGDVGGKATPNPASAELIAAAGGVGNVTTYCQSLLTGPSATTTQGPGKAAGHSTGPPSPHPTGQDSKVKSNQSAR
ncbi:MAG: hypothetical protein QOE61_3445 [Micromonosporaceae bacterium]|nr:hypothetical protein [Micromonosporaceae bacterium]